MTLSTSTVTLAPGSSRTYSLAPGEAVTVATEPNCYVTVTETPDVIASADLDGQTNVRTSILQYKGEWTYGPYALGGTVAVAVSLSKSTSSVSATLGSTVAAVVGAAGPQTLAGNATNRTIKQFINTVGVAAVNSGTAATVSIDAASPFGRPAYKIAMPAGNTYHEVQLSGLNLANFDGHIVWRVWIEDYTAVGQITMYAGTSGYGRLWQDRYRLGGSDRNRWNGEHILYVGPLASADANTFVRGADTLNDIKLRISPTAATAANVWVDAVFIPGVARPTHLITYDDCSVTWLSNVLPYLEANALKGTFGISTGDIGTNPALYLSSAQVAQIAAEGHQISPHNVTNTAYADGIGGTQNAATYTGDFITAQAALRGIVGNTLDATYHPWVQGRNNQAVHDTMRAEGLRLARGTDIGYNFPQIGLGNGAMALKIQSLNTLTTSQIDTILDNAERYGLTVAWMVHEVTQNGGVGVETSIAVHRYLCEQIGARVKQNRCAHRRASELARELYSERMVATSFLP